MVFEAGKIALLVIVMMTKVDEAGKDSATTKVNVSFWRSAYVTIKPIAPGHSRADTIEEIGQKIVKMLDLALVNRDVIHARKKRRKPAVYREMWLPAPPANTGKPRSLEVGKGRL